MDRQLRRHYRTGCQRGCRTTRSYHSSQNYDICQKPARGASPDGYESGGRNLFRYAGNNPINWHDAFGHVVGTGFSKKVDPNQNTVVCRGGKLEVQISPNSAKKADVECTKKHEQLHISQFEKRYGADACKGVEDGRQPADAGDDFNEWTNKNECEAHKLGHECRRRKYFCGGPKTQAEKDDLTQGMANDRLAYEQVYKCLENGFNPLHDDSDPK